MIRSVRALAVVLLLVPAALCAHVGGVDSQGGHTDRSADTYHFHRGPLKGQSFADKAAGTAALAALGGEAVQQVTVPSPKEAIPAPRKGTSDPFDLALFLPTSDVAGQVVVHSAYTLEYSEEHEQAAWVVYRITGYQLNDPVERTDDFRSDPLVGSGSAILEDYAGSGYDRGHLAPAAALAWARHVMSESFLLSNMSPQEPGFNRGVWKKLEAKVREFATVHEEVIVVTGPVLQEELPKIGPSGVSVPNYYYKVVLDYVPPVTSGIGFVLPNESSDRPLAAFAVPIDSVEVLTGIDFFAPLDDENEAEMEGRVDLEHWFPKQ